MTTISTIEGIGPVYTAKLESAGITTVESLLEKGCTASGRKAIATASTLEESQILKWVNMADLCRIKGVGSEYSELLEAAGVDTIKELRNRNPENLYRTIVEVNESKNLVRQTPALGHVENWVTEAKELEPMVSY